MSTHPYDIGKCFNCGKPATCLVEIIQIPLCTHCKAEADDRLAIAIFGKKRVEIWKQQIAEKGEAA